MAGLSSTEAFTDDVYVNTWPRSRWDGVMEWGMQLLNTTQVGPEWLNALHALKRDELEADTAIFSVVSLNTCNCRCSGEQHGCI
jgi:hypothetical protein